MIERLRALEKKWRAAGDAETKRADGDGLSDGEQGWHHGRGEQYDNCADELATLIAELGQEVGAEQADSCCAEDDGCPTEMAVLKRFWRQHSSPAHTSEARDANSARYEWLKRHISHADFEPADGVGIDLIFRLPTTCAISANLDATLDAAMRQEGGSDA